MDCELTLSEANRRDFDKLPDDIRAGLTAYFFKRHRDAAEVLFGADSGS